MKHPLGQKYLITDADDTLVRWHKGFKDFLERKGILVKDPTSWDIKTWVEHSDPQALVVEFNQSKDFGTLLPYPDALDMLPRFLDSGYRVAVVSSCGKDLETASQRLNNLVGAFGDIFHEIICLPLGASKYETLLKYPAGSIWVDDHGNAATAGADAGLKAHLLDRSHNKEHLDSRVVRIEDWYSLESLL